jgi:prepilin-type N-terminal cleavage/methylation domain-containing protein
MAPIKFRLHNPAGFTLSEVLIALFLVGIVFAGAISVYISVLSILRVAQQNDVSASPVVMLENLAKQISLSNSAGVRNGNSQLSIRSDYNCATGTINGGTGTPIDTTDDSWRHYRFVSNALRFVCDSSAGTTVNGADLILVNNIDTGNSAFALTNPSAQGLPTVVNILLVSTSPVLTVDTSAVPGAASKPRF